MLAIVFQYECIGNAIFSILRGPEAHSITIDAIHILGKILHKLHLNPNTAHLGFIATHLSPHPHHQLVHLLGSCPFAIDVGNEAKHSLDGHEGLSHQKQTGWVTIQLKVL